MVLSPFDGLINLVAFAELYQQTLAKALAHFFQAKLLLLDLNDFSLKVKLICRDSIFLKFSFSYCIYR